MTLFKKTLWLLAAAMMSVAALPAYADDDDDDRRQPAKVQRYDRDDDDDDRRQPARTQAATGKLISSRQAAALAVRRVGGRATDVDLIRRSNRNPLYEVEVKARNGRQYEVRLDARTGRILSVKRDND